MKQFLQSLGKVRTLVLELCQVILKHKNN
jgi:hypothetical protein